MRSEDVERIRRSLAMSPSLTPESAAELIRHLDETAADRRAIRELVDELEALAEELRRIGG